MKGVKRTGKERGRGLRKERGVVEREKQLREQWRRADVGYRVREVERV